LLLVFLVVVVEMRSAPADIGTLAYGETGGQVTSGQASANNPIPEPIAALAAGLRSKDFWLLLLHHVYTRKNFFEIRLESQTRDRRSQRQPELCECGPHRFDVPGQFVFLPGAGSVATTSRP